MELKEIIQGVKYKFFGNFENLEIKGLHFDSRKVESETIFVACRGLLTDGHRFIPMAIEKGAKVVVCEELGEMQSGILYLLVEDSTEALAQLAANFYEHPSKDFYLVGITGTNGKTTTATLLYHLFRKLGHKAGLISTIGNQIDGRLLPGKYTTPDAVAVNILLAEMRDAACEYVFMEVSSHGLVQKRVAGLRFAGGIFSNMSHEHLDYHGSFQNYIQAKKMFFDGLDSSAFALTNLDDKRGMVMLQNTKAEKHTYALRQLADFKAKIIENNLSGLILDLEGKEFHARLVGDFNAYNLLAVYATAILLGEESIDVMTALSDLQAVEGRFEYFHTTDKQIMGIVDYAHTPDALEKVLQTINRLQGGRGRLLTLLGCGGDRDRSKRPEMARVACHYSQQVILTSDNPRTEEPKRIVEEMEKGVPVHAQRKTWSIINRKTAIEKAFQWAEPGDVILLAGKGHENYQEINGKRYPFDDRKILEGLFNPRVTT